MAAKPRVGVTGNARRWTPSWWCLRLALRLAGAIPVRISLRHTPDSETLDALIISGGDDIGPALYGGEADAKKELDPKRDELEIEWINRALQSNIPLLGICRGAQLINVVLGGKLHQDIRKMRKLTYNRPGLLPTKQVELDPDSVVAKVCGRKRLRVNSLHYQAIRDPGDGLRVVGRDLDQIVQAVECTSKRQIIGVQWHPEYLMYMPSHFALFRWLLRKTE